jgi:tripartite-type tricarboxylate transporter receptor subunit TctC
MPGAGGLLAANYLFNTAARDGSVLAITGRTMAIEPLIGNPNAKFDGRKFSWLGTANVETTTCLAWHTSPVKTLQDAMTTELVVGGTGADATEVIFPKAVNKLVGTRFKIVIGYQSSADMNLAMERGELAGNCGLGWMIVKRRLPNWLADNKISILFQMGLRKHPDLAAVPLISDFAKTAEDRQVFEFLFAPQEMGRPFFAPPGVPAERVQALRAAFEQTLKDAQFLAEADRLGLEVKHGGGDAIDRLLERLYATPETVIERVKAITE